MTARRTSLAAKGHRRYGLATSDAATVRKARLCVAQWAAEHSLSIREARDLLDMITPEEGDVR
jgi:hypothetical protein